MPNDDISHPIPDLTGYITEGQIVLGRELDRRGIYPPVRVLPSLSRLMNAGIGEGRTHADHPSLANQLFASYARADKVRVLASVMGEDSLPDVDKSFLAFGRAFEERLVNQEGSRTLEESMAVGWELLHGLPVAQLTRLKPEQIARYLSAPAKPASEKSSGAPHG
jgi:V/A-type H+-transporting ATPase subunit B